MSAAALLDSRLAGLRATLDAAEAVLAQGLAQGLGRGDPAVRLDPLEAEVAALCRELGSLDEDARHDLLPRLVELSEQLARLDRGVARQLAKLEARIDRAEPETGGAS